ncbi:pyocin knob domain-containing protein [Chelativorans sp. J32]|uniref:pyocin knob domain-containing protein n=1 Tax=Chelativorans sp. J32 TaxID=935840 RepID=UPI0004ADB918|nr:pyocin knob domain-containing protein [Chelativorans sp. J32]
MAGRPDYRAGTVTLTNGSKAFTTSGAALQTAGITRGDMIWANGLFLIIDEVTGQNSGTLADACPSGAAGTRPLVVRYQADGSRLSAFVIQLTAALANGNVEALSALQGQANRFPIFTGAGTMDLAILTAFTRTLLESNDVSETVAKLAAGFGWGANNTNINVPGGSLNTLRVNGVYRALGETVGSPPGNGVWQVIHAGQAGNYAVQLAFQITSIAFPAVFVRVLNNGTWGAWNSLTDFQPNLQTVSNFELGRLLSGDRLAYIDLHAQDGVDNSARIIRNSGANGSFQIVNQGSGGIHLISRGGGIRLEPQSDGLVSSTGPIQLPANPTAALHAATKQYVDAVVQTGINANGRYVRYADGTQICWGAVTGTVPAAPGATYASTNFPIAFTASPYTLVSPNTSLAQRFNVSIGAVSAGGLEVAAGDNVGSGVSMATNWIAIGRWF